MGITPREEERCEELQEYFWRTILQVPRGTPKVALRAETGSLKMKVRIWKQKLMLAKRIREQEGGLAKEIFEEQVAMGWPGLAREVTEVCKVVGLEDVSKKRVTKEEVDEAIFFANQKEIKEEMIKYEKLKDIKNEDFRKEQKYMEEKGIERGRMAFRVRTKMVKKVKMNFKSMYLKNLKCEACDQEEDETQEHLLVCPGWAEQVGSLDTTRIEDRVEFFIRVMKLKR